MSLFFPTQNTTNTSLGLLKTYPDFVQPFCCIASTAKNPLSGGQHFLPKSTAPKPLYDRVHPELGFNCQWLVNRFWQFTQRKKWRQLLETQGSQTAAISHFLSCLYLLNRFSREKCNFNLFAETVFLSVVLRTTAGENQGDGNTRKCDKCAFHCSQVKEKDLSTKPWHTWNWIQWCLVLPLWRQRCRQWRR